MRCFVLLLGLLFVILLGACGGDDAGTLDTGTRDAGDSATDSALPTDAAPGDGYCPIVGYSECGGDLIGTWAFRDLCPEDPAAAAALCEHPFDDQPVCAGTGNEAVCDGNQTGTLTFNTDGTVDVATETVLIGTWNYTNDCLAAVTTSGGTPEEQCDSLNNGRQVCTFVAGCTCVGEPIMESFTNNAPYEVVGNDLTLGDDPPSSYCIDGDLLTMDYYVFHPVSWRYWVLERQ
jgi:hypothetical protein